MALVGFPPKGTSLSCASFEHSETQRFRGLWKNCEMEVDDATTARPVMMSSIAFRLRREPTHNFERCTRQPMARLSPRKGRNPWKAWRLIFLTALKSNGSEILFDGPPTMPGIHLRWAFLPEMGFPSGRFQIHRPFYAADHPGPLEDWQFIAVLKPPLDPGRPGSLMMSSWTG